MEEQKKKLKGNISYLYIIFIIGIIILLFGNSILGKTKSKDDTKQSEVQLSDLSEDEKRLEKILSEIKGVGSVSVMITYENGGVSNYLSDSTYENKNENADVKKTEKVVMTSGTPVVYEQTLPKVKGVIVVCSGAKNEQVKENVVSAVCAVTGVYEHKVGVFEKNGGV